MKHKIIGYFIALIFLLLGFMGMKKMVASKKAPERVETPQSIKLVKADLLKNGDVAVQIPISGKLESFNKVELFSEVGGIMLKGNKDFKEGISFNKGELIFQIDSRDVKAALVAQRSSFLTLLTQISPDIKLDYTANYTAWDLYIQKFNPESSIQELPEPVSAQEKSFLTTKNIYNSFYNIKSQELKLSKYTVYAPFDGVLSMASIQYGTIIRPGQKLGELIQPSIYELEAPVNIKDVSYLKTGDKVNLVSNDIGGKWNGKVERIGKNIDAQTQSVMVYIAVSGSDLKEGMYLNGKIASEKISNSVRINRKLLNDDGSIFGIEDGKLIKYYPKIEKVNETTIIVSGLKESTELLAEPFVGAYEGMSVQTVN